MKQMMEDTGINGIIHGGIHGVLKRAINDRDRWRETLII